MLDLGALSVKILADSSSAVATMTSFQNTVDNTSNSITSSITTLGNSLTSIGTNMSTKVTLPLVGVAAAVTKVGADFEAQMSTVQAISGATGSDLERLKEKAREIGATTALSSKQAAEGLEYMALAGWKTTEMLEGYDGIVNLALSSNMELGRASDIVTDYLTAFGLAASDAGHFADVMAYAMSNSNTTTQMLGDAYKNCASTANSFGVSVEETTAWLGKMADAGVKGGEAGTTLNAVLARMYGETKTTNDAMMEYGLTMYDTEGKAKGFTQIMSEIEEAMKGMTEQQQNVFLKAVAGTNQLSGFATMIKAGTGNVIEFTEALRDSDGAATEMAEIMTDNLSGSIEILISNLEETGIQLYEMKEGPIKSFVDGLDDMITSFQRLDDDTKNTIITLAAVVAAIGPVTLVLGTTVKSIGALGGAFSALLANPIVAGITALAAAMGYLAIKTLEAKAKQEEWNEKMQEALLMTNDFTESTTQETEALKNKADALGKEIAYVDNYSKSLEDNAARMEEIIDTMGELDASREEDILKIQELEKEYQALANETKNMSVALLDSKSASQEHIQSLEDEYGSIENARHVYEAYKIRLENIEEAKKTLSQCTTDSSKSLASEALQLATNSAQAQALVTKYISLSQAEANNSKESGELRSVREALTKIVGDEAQYIDESTGKWAINTDAVYDQILANDNLAEGKRQACIAMNKNDVELLKTCVENSKARIKAWETELNAYAQIQMAELQANNTAIKIYENGGLLTKAQLEARKRAEETSKAIEVEKSKLAEYEKGIANLSATLDQSSGSVGDFGDATKKSGDKSSKAAKDALQAWQEMYTQKKKLGEIDLEEQIVMLDEMKSKYSDSAEHIISVNEFAQSEILNIVQQRKEQESITVDEEIALYEMAKEKYCANAADRQAFEEQINKAIKDNVQELTSDITNMDLEKLEGLKSTLSDMKDKYDDYSYDVEFIEESITEITKEEYKKRKEELDNTLNEMKSSIDKFYGKQEDELDAESKAKQDKLQAEIAALEAQQAEKERIEREAKLLKSIAEAEDEEARKEAQSKYDDWLVEQKKKALKELLQAEKDDLADRKGLIEDQKTNLKELLDYQYLLEAEKLEVQKNNQNLTDAEVETIARENLDKRMQEEVDTMSNNLQTLLNNASDYENLGKMQMQYYIDGLKSYEDAITSYFSGLAPSEYSGGMQSIDGSHSNGLESVPYNGYIAELHKGERVLTESEANRYRDNEAQMQQIQQITNVFDASTIEGKLDKLTRTVSNIVRQKQIADNMA